VVDWVTPEGRLGLGVHLAIDRPGVHPFGGHALLEQFDMLCGDELWLFRGLLARRPRRPGLDRDGTSHSTRPMSTATHARIGGPPLSSQVRSHPSVLLSTDHRHPAPAQAGSRHLPPMRWSTAAESPTGRDLYDRRSARV
jgi:hypothetical protein